MAPFERKDLPVFQDGGYLGNNEFRTGAIGIYKGDIVQLECHDFEKDNEKKLRGHVLVLTDNKKEVVHAAWIRKKVVTAKHFIPLTEQSFNDYCTNNEKKNLPLILKKGPKAKQQRRLNVVRPSKKGGGASGGGSQSQEIMQMRLQMMAMQQQMMMMAAQYQGGVGAGSANGMPFMMMGMGGVGAGSANMMSMPFMNMPGGMMGSMMGRGQAAGSKESRGRDDSGDGVKDLTYEEKRQLGKDINKLQPEQVQKVIDILYENGAPQGENGEIEIDMETFDTASLRRLKSYVKRALKPKGKKAPGSAANMLARVENAAAATQKRKRELMEQQASLLEQDGGKRARHDDDSDSDSEEEGCHYY